MQYEKIKRISKLKRISLSLENYIGIWNLWFRNISNKGLLVYHTAHLFTSLANRLLHRKIPAFKFFSKSQVLRTKDGLFYCRKGHEDISLISPIFEKHVQKHFRLDKGVFVDVGACIGRYTIKVARQLGKNGKVISIEPEASNFANLKKNIELNKLKNVTPFNMACFSSKSKLTLLVHEKRIGLHSVVRQYGPASKRDVRGDTLDNILKRLKVKKVNLLKIDVEGVEHEVLQGALKTIKRDIPRIIFEAWNDSYLQKCTDILLPLGYLITEVDKENFLAVPGKSFKERTK